MSLVVVDASALAAFYASNESRRAAIAQRLSAGNALFAPAHLDVEVVSALRGMGRRDARIAAATPTALQHLAGFPIRRMPLAPLVDRIWELRDNATAYAAAYVALAERIDGVLLTCDRELVAANRTRCRFDLIA